MTISGITSTYASFSAMRLTISVSGGQTAPRPSSGGAASPIDSVTLSPEAAAPAAESPAFGRAAAAATPTAPASQAAPPSSSDRAAALFAALDADQDGAITEDEFKTGAKRLLSRDRPARRADDDRHDHGHGDHAVHAGRGSRRLERKLDRLFDRVDGNGDGSLDADELTDALARAERRQPPPPPQTPDTASRQDGTTFSFTMTVVSIAVKRYTSLQAADAPTTTAAPAASDSDTTGEPAVAAPATDATTTAATPPAA